MELTFTEQTTKQFLEQVAEWPVQALEYKSFLRFRVGKILTMCVRISCNHCC
ncbi:carbon starvation induced protein CsiD [Escherichia coli]